MSKNNLIEVCGIVQDELGRGKYRIETESGLIMAQLSGKIRMNKIRVIVGDKVTVGVSPYDMTNGLILFRGEKKKNY